jgi:hypothetical protein
LSDNFYRATLVRAASWLTPRAGGDSRCPDPPAASVQRARRNRVRRTFSRFRPEALLAAGVNVNAVMKNVHGVVPHMIVLPTNFDI